MDPVWQERYGARTDAYRLPSGRAERDRLAQQTATDGYRLLEAVHADTTPSRLREVPAVAVLRMVWIQQFTRTVTDQEQEVCWRGKNDLLPGRALIASPYDPEARYSRKRGSAWTGFKVHLSENCDDPDQTGRPHLITHVVTTDATANDATVVDTVHGGLERKGLKIGRTQLQDAVPMTLGQEFSAFATTLGEDEQRLAEAATLLTEINLGGTAIGTGLNAHPDYARLACDHLRTLTALPLVTASDLVEAAQDVGVFVQLSGVLKRIAVKLSKTCNDLRLLSSGPQAGLGELNLPKVQAGSSIMPGKVNPVVPEVVNQVAYEAIGNDMTITMATEAGQLQLNAFEPIIAHSLLKSVRHPTAACTTPADRCVRGITANTDRLRRQVEESIGLVTVLNPVIGYDAASALARDALTSGRTITDLALAVPPAPMTTERGVRMLRSVRALPKRLVRAPFGRLGA